MYVNFSFPRQVKGKGKSHPRWEHGRHKFHDKLESLASSNILWSRSITKNINYNRSNVRSRLDRCCMASEPPIDLT